ncbi:glycosyltransferase [Pseudanabaena sp. UWO311]|uniref:glycosyltransferase n=1 Tax=Pseudanabaena sp. UWO311 TaxID=2487337 RepID=UPI001158CAC0|nr:glycosyltransferase [Pseudanabaena sp. UWO311]TYQ26957.1 glycosyltransferase [Pseudanabaena sp. UWO311]
MQISDKQPLLSIAIPVYNGENFLEKCLNSVSDAVAKLDKTEQNLVEVILCDNCSSDRSLEIARNHKFECAYQFIQTPEYYDNRTLNWRHALAQSQGNWMMMLHADDLMSVDGLGNLLAACKSQVNSSSVMIAGRIRTFSDTSSPSRLKPLWASRTMISGEELRKRVLPLICPFVPFTVMRRSAYIEVGGLNIAYELVQDWELWIRLLSLGDLYFYPSEFGLWRTHGFSEKYAKIFAVEHTLLSLDIRNLVPNLSSNQAQICMEIQLAKARNWLPDISTEGFSQIIQNAPDTLIKSFPSYEEAQKRLKWASRQVSLWLYWLRFLGMFRL